MTSSEEGPQSGVRRLASDRASVLAWAAVVGLLAGGVGAGFRLGIRHLESLFDATAKSGSPILSVLLGATFVGAAFLLVQRFAPETAGSGIQEIEGALQGDRPLRWARVLVIKFTGGLLSLAAGMVMGREGPTVQMGGALGQMLRERFGLSEEQGRVLIAAGAGAGLAAAFNAPLAGMLFVIEEMRRQFHYSVVSVQCVVIACAASDLVVRALLGGEVAISVGIFPMPPLPGLLSLALLGACLGLIGWAFNGALLHGVGIVERLSWAVRLAIAISIGAGIGGLGYFQPDLVGGGYRAIHDALGGVIPTVGLLTVFLVRFGLTVGCFVSGVPGGIFAPLVALGTIFGVWFAHIIPGWAPAAGVDPGVFMIAGTGALFAATVRAPLTGIVLAAELTGNFGLILPVAIACIAATLVAHALGGQPIYSSLLARSLAHAPESGDQHDSRRN